jgi:hypothetical protein
MASVSEHVGGQFNPEDHPDEFELLPPGEYVAQIIESGIIPTKAGDGQMVKFTFEITEGELERRLIWVRVNISNPNAQAQNIGRKELAKIAVAAGVGIFDDTEELHYKPMLITVAHKEDKTGQYGPQNVIRAYRALDGAPAAHATPAPASNPAPAPKTTPPAAGGPAKPWTRRKAA